MPMITMEQLQKLQQSAQKELDADKSKSSGDKEFKYPVVYLGNNGRLTVRILFNMGLGGIQRKLVRHEVGKEKVGCLAVYTEDCNVCSAIREVEDFRGKDCGARRKYGYKVRGVCYAQIIDFPDKYFDGKDIKKKDVVILMYPKTVYDQINKLIVDSGENLSQVVCDNDGIPLVIERSQKNSNSIPDYTVSFYPFGKKKSFDESDCTNGKTPDDMFQDMLGSLPNLAEQFVPVCPNDDVRTANRAAADTIRQEYLSDRTVNPSDDQIYDNRVDTKYEQIVEQSTQNVVAQVDSNKPDCFGNHDSHDQGKCLVCPYEVECVCS